MRNCPGLCRVWSFLLLGFGPRMPNPLLKLLNLSPLVLCRCLFPALMQVNYRNLFTDWPAWRSKPHLPQRTRIYEISSFCELVFSRLSWSQPAAKVIPLWGSHWCSLAFSTCRSPASAAEVPNPRLLSSFASESSPALGPAQLARVALKPLFSWASAFSDLSIFMQFAWGQLSFPRYQNYFPRNPDILRINQYLDLFLPYLCWMFHFWDSGFQVFSRGLRAKCWTWQAFGQRSYYFRQFFYRMTFHYSSANFGFLLPICNSWVLWVFDPKLQPGRWAGHQH